MLRMLDLFCGRFGWGKAFAARGWDVVGIDLVEPPEVPQGCSFIQANIFDLQFRDGAWRLTGLGVPHQSLYLGVFDFICASSSCEQFSVHGMKHFHPNPPYPELGVRLFNHARALCEASGVPYVMENVRAAQQFVGNAVNHCGPFYIWGSAVPPLMPQGIKKGMDMGNAKWDRSTNYAHAKRNGLMMCYNSKSPERKALTAAAATIPPELANCIADYAERLQEAVAC